MIQAVTIDNLVTKRLERLHKQTSPFHRQIPDHKHANIELKTQTKIALLENLNRFIKPCLFHNRTSS